MAGIALLLSSLCLNSTICNQDVDSGVNYNLRQKGNILNENESLKTMTLDALARELKGQTLRVTTLEDYPLSYVIRENGTLVGRGTSFEFLDFLMQKYDFKYELVLPKFNILGSSNDTEGSIMQMISKNEVDIAVAFLPILADARKHVLFSAALDEGEWKIIMTRPQESASGAGLLAPFHEIVWYLILVSLIVVGPVIYSLLVLYKRFTKDPDQQFYNLHKCVWFVYGALMKQGSTLSPTADSIRIIFATWWIYITILTSFYTANLTAFLTLSRFTLPINNPKDILSKKQAFISQRGFAIEYAIKNAEEELSYLKPLLDKSLATFTNQNNDTDILLNQVLKKNLVFIRDRPAIDHLVYEDYRGRKFQPTERLQCPFAMSKEISLKRKRGFAYPKNTKWNDLFDPQLQYLVESGIVKFKLNYGLPKAEICPQDLGSTERQLRLQDLFTTYLTMLAGFSTALVVFFTEMFFRYINSRKNRIVLKNTESQTRRIMVKPSRKPKKAFVNEAKIISPPPAYGDAIKTIFTTGSSVVGAAGSSPKPAQVESYKTLNGRTYAVVKDDHGTQLVPTRQPSAALFNYQYAYNSYN